MLENNIIDIAGKRLLQQVVLPRILGCTSARYSYGQSSTRCLSFRVGNQMLLDLDDIPEWLSRHKYRPGE